MPLQGSLETFALPDVLTLLASTAKSGELRVTGAGADGRVWLLAGELVASESGPAVGHADVLFELLRLDGGTFVFTEGELEGESSPEPIAPVLEEAAERLEAWNAIAAVVPSMAVSVGLSGELRSPSVTLTADRWRAIVAVASARTVADVAHRLGLGEFDACRLVKELVDDGLVVVAVADPPVIEEEEPVAEDVEPDPQPAPPSADEVSAANVDEDDDPLSALSEAAARIGALPTAIIDDPSPLSDGEVVDGEVVFDGDEPINRGLLLKFLSSVRS